VATFLEPPMVLPSRTDELDFIASPSLPRARHFHKAQTESGYVL